MPETPADWEALSGVRDRRWGITNSGPCPQPHFPAQTGPWTLRLWGSAFPCF